MAAMDKGAVPEWLQQQKDDSVPLKNSMHIESGPDAPSSSSSSSSSSAASSSASMPPAVAAAVKGLPKMAVMIQWGLRIVTMMICMLMAATSLVGLSSVTGVNATGKIFVAVYMFFFAALLFVFEGVQIKNIEALDHVFRRNFGFLYNVMGKSFFIIFVGFLSFGLGEPENLSFCTGLVFAGFGAAELALFLKYPEFFE